MSAAVLAHARQVATAAGLGSDAIARLERLPALLDYVQRFGARWNLVGDASARGVVDEHIVESLALAGLVEKQGVPASIVDVGAGAGLELLLWLLLWPEARGTAVEPRRKRADFIELAAGHIGVLSRLTVVRGRLGEPGCPPLATPFALATSRATFAPETWLAFGAELVEPAGRVTAHLPAGVEPQIPDGWGAAGRVGVPGRGDHEVVVYVRKDRGD